MERIDSMADQLRFLGIAGSLRQGSYNRGLIRAAVELAPADVTIEIYEDLGSIPSYNGDIEAQGEPAPVQDLKTRIRAVDALLIATPEYNYSVPGVLKNAVDWASRPPKDSVLHHKPVALMGASTGHFGTARAQLALRQSFLFTKSFVVIEPEVYVWTAEERFDSAGNLTDQPTRDRVRRLVESLARWTRGLRAGGIIG